MTKPRIYRIDAKDVEVQFVPDKPKMLHFIVYPNDWAYLRALADKLDDLGQVDHADRVRVIAQRLEDGPPVPYAHTREAEEDPKNWTPAGREYVRKTFPKLAAILDAKDPPK